MSSALFSPGPTTVEIGESGGERETSCWSGRPVVTGSIQVPGPPISTGTGICDTWQRVNTGCHVIWVYDQDI